MKKKWINGAYVPHRLDMLQSPAWRSLSGAAKAVLDRIEIERMKHASQKNGELIVTYNNFADYGVRRRSIADAIRQAVAHGFLDITRRGRRSAAGANPAHYRLTYLPTADADPTDEWRDVKPKQRKPRKRTVSGAKTPPTQRKKNQNVGGEIAPVSEAKTPPISGAKTPLPKPDSSGAKTPLPSIIYPYRGRRRR